MRASALSYLVFTAMALAAVAMPSPAAAGPVELGPAALDAVTAGTSLDLATASFAEGQVAFTSSSTQTHVIDLEGSKLGIGVGFSSAFACCDPSSTATSSASAEADLTFGNTFIGRITSTRLVYVTTISMIVAVIFPPRLPGGETASLP
jgi:hypothetical protein